MPVKRKSISCKKPVKRGRGILNKIINNLPFELHIPGYQYCGPGTKVAKRVERGDPGINPLDAACKEHDISYSKNRENIEARNAADKVLEQKAWQRVFAKDAPIGEKLAAYGITNTMKVKSKFGMGMKTKKNMKKKRKNRKKKSTLRKIITAAKASMKVGKNVPSTIKSALHGARKAVKEAGGKRNINKPRVLPMPSKVGGVLPFLLPLFAGLSATGALAGGAAGIAKAVNDANAAKRQLEESKRHNTTMESIALGKGLYLKPYNTGLGLYLKPYKTGHGCKSKNLK